MTVVFFGVVAATTGTTVVDSVAVEVVTVTCGVVATITGVTAADCGTVEVVAVGVDETTLAAALSTGGASVVVFEFATTAAAGKLTAVKSS